MKNRLLLAILLLSCWAAPAVAGEAEEAACIAAPSEDCIVAMFLDTATSREDIYFLIARYADLGRAYGEAGRIDESRRYFELALQLTESSTDPKLHTRAFVAIGRQQGWGGDWPAAMETLRQVPDSVASRPPYDFYAWHLADIGEFEFAFEAASRLPYPQPRLDYLRHLAQRQAEAGNIDGAWKSFWAMLPGDVTSIQDVERYFADRPEGLPVNIFVALGAIAAAEVRAGDLNSALMLERLPHKPWSAPFQGIAAQIAGALAETGKVGEALTKATAIESIVERQNAIEMIFDVLAENGEWKRAKEVAPMIDAHARSFEAVLRLAELQAASGDLPGAIDTYDTVMEGSTLFFRHLAENQLEATQLAIAGALIRRGDRDTAEHYYDQVLLGLPWRYVDRQVRPLSFYRDILDLVGRVAVARYKAGDAEGAAALVDEAVAFSDRDRMAKSQQEDVVGRLVSIQCQTGLFTAALKTAVTAKSQSGLIDALSCTLRGVLTGQ